VISAAPGESPVPRKGPRGPLQYVVLGALIGFAIGGFIALRSPAVAGYSEGTTVLFVAAALGFLGGVAGAVAFVLLDNRARRTR